MAPAIAVAIASVAFTPTVFTRLPWPAVAPIAMVGAALWATALALIGGPASVVRPITTVPEYVHGRRHGTARIVDRDQRRCAVRRGRRRAVCVRHAGAARGRRSTAFAVVAGLLLGACLLLSYGLVLLAPLVVAIVIVQRRPGPLVAAAVAVVVVVAAFAAAGFLWWQGYALTRDGMRTSWL